MQQGISEMDFATLKAKHRLLRDGFSTGLALRTHRALSWLHKAELTTDDLDARFIFLWIAFNAAYAVDVDEQYRTTEKGMFEQFFAKLVVLDHEKQLYNLAWAEFSNTIRVLLDNPYIFQPFWDYHNGKLTEDEWLSSFKLSKARAGQGLANHNTKQILSIVFRRIYTLRNQIIHGGATWQGKANRQQIKDCTALLAKVVPVIIELMMDHPDELWGDPYYPLLASPTRH